MECIGKSNKQKITGILCFLSSSSLEDDVIGHCCKASLMGFGCFFVTTYHEPPPVTGNPDYKRDLFHFHVLVHTAKNAYP